MADNRLTIDEIERWLRQTNPDRLEQLWRQADTVRRQFVGNAVHLRGLIEISNHCVRGCRYCGLNAANDSLVRYRMSAEEILACAHLAVEFGYGTIVIQAGEDPGIETDWLADIVRRIKQQTPLAVTLSLGERPVEDLLCWRQAGADRYLLRFETSDTRLYDVIHPSSPGQLNRIELLGELRRLGYEVGSGVMVGIPGQSLRSLAEDIDLFGRLDLDMIGIGPFIPNPHTPLGSGELVPHIDPAEQVANTDLMTCKAVALTRLVCPQSNIPSTTALATINPDSGRELGLTRGANIVMPNLTPLRYRTLYEIYPGKACINETADACNACLRTRIESIGRTIGSGPGGRKRISNG
jgi:biotin synthase